MKMPHGALRLFRSNPEVKAMDNEDTVVLTPEEKEKVLNDIPEDEQQDDEGDED